jgi:hypothetical protein
MAGIFNRLLATSSRLFSQDLIQLAISGGGFVLCAVSHPEAGRV